MKLPISLPSFNKKAKVEYFLILLLRDEKISALIAEQNLGKMNIIGKHEDWLPTPLEEIEVADLIVLLDKTISKAEETLATGIDPQNTVFGVKDTWVEEKKIKKEYLVKLKKVCDELSLTPMGFIVIAEAITHLIQKEEGAPLSALLTELGQSTVSISLFRAGRLIEAKHAPNDGTPMKTVDTLLKSFEVEILPSRIILLHTGIEKADHTQDSVAQKFIAHQWSKSLPFLHVPQVSILPFGFDGKALVFGAATQLGFEFIGLMDTSKDIAFKTYEQKHLISSEAVVEQEIKDEEQVDTPVKKSDELDNDGKKHDEELDLTTVAADNFGFVIDKDISTLPIASHPKKEAPHHATMHVTHDEPEETLSETTEQNDEESFSEPVGEKPAKKSRRFFFGNVFSPIRSIRLPKVTLPKGNKILFIPPLFLLILIALATLYIFKLKATVTVVVAPKIVDEAQKVILSTTADTNFATNTIGAKAIIASLDGSATTNATGQKEVGDKAKGTITIYNSDETRKTVKEGTAVTSSNGLSYLLDKDIIIASASGDIFTGIKSGTAQIAVTAKNIGTEYNLPSNTKFSVEGSSVLAAKNDTAFSGGSKKKVTVIAQKDVDKLTNDLPKSLEQKAKETLQQNVQNDEIIIPGFISTGIDKEKLDNKVGEEAKTVKLTATVTFTAISYHKNNVIQYSQAKLKEKFSQDQTIPGETIITDISGIKKKSDTEMNGLLSIKAGLLPKLDNPTIIKRITGKSFSEVDDYIKTLPQVKEAQIELSPNIPYPKNLPRISDNITLIIKPNE